MNRKPLQVAILISGGGTTMEQVLLSTLPSGRLYGKVEVAGVISSSETAGGIERVRKFNESHDQNVRCIVLNLAQFENDSWKLGSGMVGACKGMFADVVIGCGYLKKVPKELLGVYPDLVFNQHCGLLDPGFPDFGGPGMYGTAVHEATLRFAKAIGRPVWTRAVVHKMTREYDKGGIICQSDKVKVDRRWTAKTLQQKVLPLEHLMVMDALGIIAEHFPDRSVPTVSLDERVVREGEEEAWRRAVDGARAWTKSVS